MIYLMICYFLNIKNYFIVYENKFNLRNNHLVLEAWTLRRHEAICFINHLTVTCSILHLIFPLSLSLLIILYYIRIWKTVNRVGWRGSLESAFDLITNACCRMHQFSFYVSLFIVMRCYRQPEHMGKLIPRRGKSVIEPQVLMETGDSNKAVKLT